MTIVLTDWIIYLIFYKFIYGVYVVDTIDLRKKIVELYIIVFLEFFAIYAYLRIRIAKIFRK